MNSKFTYYVFVLPFLLVVAVLFFQESFAHELAENDGGTWEGYGYIDETGKYGNPPYSTPISHRKLVEGGDYLFIGLHNTLVRTDLDGKNTTILLETTLGQISYYDGWVYFSNMRELNNSYYISNALYKVRPDGSDLQEVYKSESNAEGALDSHAMNENDFGHFYIVNDIIYLEGEIDWSRYAVRKLDLNGKVLSDIHHEGVRQMNVVGDTIYFNERNEGFDLRRMDLDGHHIRTIAENTTFRYCYFEKDWLYYYDNGSRAIVRASVRTGERQTMREGLSDDVMCIFVKDGYLYYTVGIVDPDLYKIELIERIALDGGSEAELLARDATRMKYSILQPQIAGNYIYYHSDVDAGICRIKLDGSGKEVVNRGSVLNRPTDEKVLYENPRRYVHPTDEGLFDPAAMGFLNDSKELFYRMEPYDASDSGQMALYETPAQISLYDQEHLKIAATPPFQVSSENWGAFYIEDLNFDGYNDIFVKDINHCYYWAPEINSFVFSNNFYWRDYIFLDREGQRILYLPEYDEKGSFYRYYLLTYNENGILENDRCYRLFVKDNKKISVEIIQYEWVDMGTVWQEKQGFTLFAEEMTKQEAALLLQNEGLDYQNSEVWTPLF